MSIASQKSSKPAAVAKSLPTPVAKPVPPPKVAVSAPASKPKVDAVKQTPLAAAVPKPVPAPAKQPPAASPVKPKPVAKAAASGEAKKEKTKVAAVVAPVEESVEEEVSADEEPTASTETASSSSSSVASASSTSSKSSKGRHHAAAKPSREEARRKEAEREELDNTIQTATLEQYQFISERAGWRSEEYVASKPISFKSNTMTFKRVSPVDDQPYQTVTVPFGDDTATYLVKPNDDMEPLLVEKDFELDATYADGDVTEEQIAANCERLVQTLTPASFSVLLVPRLSNKHKFLLAIYTSTGHYYIPSDAIVFAVLKRFSTMDVDKLIKVAAKFSNRYYNDEQVEVPIVWDPAFYHACKMNETKKVKNGVYTDAFIKKYREYADASLDSVLGPIRGRKQKRERSASPAADAETDADAHVTSATAAPKRARKEKAESGAPPTKRVYVRPLTSRGKKERGGRERLLQYIGDAKFAFKNSESRYEDCKRAIQLQYDTAAGETQSLRDLIASYPDEAIPETLIAADTVLKYADHFRKDPVTRGIVLAFHILANQTEALEYVAGKIDALYENQGDVKISSLRSPRPATASRKRGRKSKKVVAETDEDAMEVAQEGEADVDADAATEKEGEQEEVEAADASDAEPSHVQDSDAEEQEQEAVSDADGEQEQEQEQEVDEDNDMSNAYLHGSDDEQVDVQPVSDEEPDLGVGDL